MTYVYCLVQSSRAPSLRGVPPGVPGAGAPRTVAFEPGMWAVVSNAPPERFTGEQLQAELQDIEAISRHALAHAAVIEFFFRAAPVIPLKIFTLFSSDEKMRQHLRSRRAGLKRMFAQVRGLEEWAVRITAGEVEAEAARSLKSGRDYLQVKKRLSDQSSSPPRATVKAANGALQTLRKLSSRMRKDAFPPPGKGRPFVTGASFLVKAKRRAQWSRQLAKISAALAAEGHRLDASGPWPPYHFVTR